MTETLIREEEAAQPAIGRKKRSRWPTLLFVVLLVSFGLVVSGVLPIQQYLERENQVNAARAELAIIEARNADLAADVDALRTDQEIERVAREQYGFVREGEIGYVVITPDAEDPAVSTPAPVTPVIDDHPGFFARIWRFLTGGDVVNER
ncbi:MAG: septum formation initiator family protein [Acidimicrobiia bacterium]|nr:septum formation initiator family protein [Acidimicrobiia bacterium]